MGDFTKLTGSISTLSGKVDQLIAKGQASDQPAIDAAQASVDAITAKADQALNPPPPPPPMT